MVLSRLLAGTGLQLGDVLPVAVAIVYSAAQLPSNIFPWHTVEKFYKMRDENGEELELTMRARRLIDRELCESGIENKKLVDIQAFVTCGAEPMSRGYFAGRFECMIGFPLYFNYESRDDVDAADLDTIAQLKQPHAYRVKRDAWKRFWKRITGGGTADNDSQTTDDPSAHSNSDPNAAPSSPGDSSPSPSSSSPSPTGAIDWNSPAGATYKDALVLSPMAKRFASARIIHETDRFHLVYAFATGYVGIEVAHAVFKRAIKNLPPAQRRMKQRFYLTVTSALGAVIFYWAVKLRNYYYERGSDVSTASIGPDFAAGGIEYYQKAMARNRALRELLGVQGEKRFTASGNVRTCFANWMEDLNIPVVHRTLASRLRTVEKIASDFDAMSYEELAFHLETKRFHRMPRQNNYPLITIDWRTKETLEFEKDSGLLEFEQRQRDARRKTDETKKWR